MARDVKFLTEDIRKAVSKGGQMASVKISNSLSSAGPIWSGRFSSAWHSIPGEKSIRGGASANGDLSVLICYEILDDA